MQIKRIIDEECYQKLESHSAMLGRIASVASRYCKTRDMTTYECIVSMEEKIHQLQAKVRNHKKAGGKFLK
jgi:hypothetical protein